MNSLFKTIILVLTLCLCVAAFAYEIHNIVVDYIRPIRAGTFGFVADFQFFYEGAQRFMENPMLLYEGNTRDGFLLIDAQGRIDYGYPPPAVLLFVPFALVSKAVAYAGFMLFSILVTVVCFVLLKRLHDWDKERIRWGIVWWVAAAFTFAAGMTYVTYVFGQVNTVVLLVCLMYIGCVMDGRYVLAGFLLGAGFWLKFYPLFLLALAPFERRPLRLLAASALGIVLIPLALQPIMPLELYRHYFSEVYPGLSAQTAPHVYNQSVIGWLTRFIEARSMYYNWGPLLVDARVKAFNLVALAAIFGWIMAGYRRHREKKLLHYACILAAAPMVVTYGWGGTYMLALPLIILTMITLSERSWAFTLLVPVLALIFIIPAYRPFDLGDQLGSVASRLYYNRYLFATALLLLCSVQVKSGQKRC